MELSLVQRIVKSKEPFILFHTHSATREAIEHAIASGKSMDLDICVDEVGSPYLGHSKEYYEKSGETQPETMTFWEAIETISRANIPVIIDCKHYDAWPIVERVINQIGAHRCLVHSFASELKFDYEHNDHDYLTEWSPIQKLASIKKSFPSATTTASCKFLPSNFLISPQYQNVLEQIREILVLGAVDTVCLNVPDNTMSDEILDFFLSKNIVPHVGIDNVNTAKLSKLYVGETDILSEASEAKDIGY